MADVTPSATAADWDQWANAGDMSPPSTPVIDNNPALASGSSNALMARMLASRPDPSMMTPDASATVPVMGGTSASAAPPAPPPAALAQPAMAPPTAALSQPAPAAPTAAPQAPMSPALMAGLSEDLAAPAAPAAAPAAAPQQTESSVQAVSTLPAGGAPADVGLPPEYRASRVPAGPIASVPLPASYATGGVTPEVMAQALKTQENGGGTGEGHDDLTSVDGAVGKYQVTPGFFKQYAQPGESFNSEADRVRVAQRGIGVLTNQYGGDPARVAVAYFSGPGNVSPAGSPTPWLVDKMDGNGYSTSRYVASTLSRIGLSPGTPSAIAVGPGPSGVVGGVDTKGQFSPQEAMASIRGLQDPLPYPGAGAPSVGNQLLAFAGGMAGARSPGMALLGGFGAAGKQATTQVAQEMQANQLASARNQQQAEMVMAAQARAQTNALLSGRLTNQEARTNIYGQKAAYDTNGAVQPVAAPGGVTTPVGPTPTNTKLSDATALANAKGGISLGNAVSKDNMDENNKQVTSLQEQAKAAQSSINDINTMQPMLAAAGSGPSALDKAVRSLATTFGINVGSDQTTQQVVQALADGNKSGTLKVAGIGRIMASEVPMLTGQVPGLMTNPAAAGIIGNFLKARSQGILNAQKEWAGMTPAQQNDNLKVSGYVGNLIQGHVPTVGDDGVLHPGVRDAMNNPPATTTNATQATPIVMHGPTGQIVRVDPRQTDSIAQLRAHGYQ